MIRIAVCDDEADKVDIVMQMIKKWSSETNIHAEICSFTSGDELIENIANLRMDVIFLDIIMPLLNGIDTAKELRRHDKAVKIIFLTSSPDFALASYEVKAQDYIIKPITYRKIKEVLGECSLSFGREQKNLVLKTSFGYQKLYFHDIEYVEALNKKVVFYLCSGKVLEVAEHVNSIEGKLLSGDSFFKCHRSYLIYLPNVQHFSTIGITTKSGRNVPIARGCCKAFQEAYFAVMFRE